MLKRLLCFTLSITMIAGTVVTASAHESLTGDNSTETTIEITEEYIQKYGIHSVDEYGNEIIEVPIGPDVTNGDSCFKTTMESDDVVKICEEDTCFGENTMSRHVSTTSHIHEIINLKKYNYSSTIPITSYAMAGMTIEKRYSQTFTINPVFTLAGGITKKQVEGSIGLQVGGSYTKGSEEAYSVTVPSGYRGRIAYRYYSDMYSFDNKTTYYWSAAPLITTEEIDACSVESAPYDGYYYLQVIEV